MMERSRDDEEQTYDVQRDAHRAQFPPAQDLTLVPIVSQLEIGCPAHPLGLKSIPTSPCVWCLRGARYSNPFVRGALVSQSAARQAGMRQSAVFPPSADTTVSNFSAQAFLPGTMTKLVGRRDGWESSTLSKRMVRSDWRSSNAFENNAGYAAGELPSDRRFAQTN